MFESAELGLRVPKKDYQREAPRLRASLLELQGELAESDFSLLILIAGAAGAGKSESANLLLEWMDARGIETHAFGDPNDEERERPRFWRYWRALPPRGKTAIHLGGWYIDPLIDRATGKLTPAELDQELDRIVEFERHLTHQNVLLLKLYLHISKETQRARRRTLLANPATRWRVMNGDWKSAAKYDAFRAVAEHALRRTSTGESPWHVVEAADERYRYLALGRILREALQRRLEDSAARRSQPPPPPDPLPVPAAVNVINRLDLTCNLEPHEYRAELLKYQGRLNLLSRKLGEKKRSAILVFEGPDAAGKGGAIRRLTAAMDARNYRVISVGRPTQEELAQPYLWRFWRHLPRRGRVTIYDRSWYGRVLVERLEGLCSREDWQRAYGEINAFEEQLVEFGIVVVKFWIAISPEEQLARFEARQLTPYKQYKIDAEDWRNRDKWDAYEAAACDMIERTSTEIAPWTLVEGEHKRWARIKVLRTTCERLEECLGA